MSAIRLPQRGWLFDLDGTVYLGEALIPGAADTIAALRAAGRRVAFLSNKPLYTREDYADKLTRLGVPTRPERAARSSKTSSAPQRASTLDFGISHGESASRGAMATARGGGVQATVEATTSRPSQAARVTTPAPGSSPPRGRGGARRCADRPRA